MVEEGVSIAYASFNEYAIAFGKWKASTKFFEGIPGGKVGSIGKLLGARAARSVLDSTRKREAILGAMIFKVNRTRLYKTRRKLLNALQNLTAYDHILVTSLDEVKVLKFLRDHPHFLRSINPYHNFTIFASDAAVNAALDELGIGHQVGETTIEARRVFEDLCQIVQLYSASEEEEQRLIVRREKAYKSLEGMETAAESSSREEKVILDMMSQENSSSEEMTRLLPFLLSCSHILVDSVDEVDAAAHLIEAGFRGALHSFDSIIKNMMNQKVYTDFVKSGNTLCNCLGRLAPERPKSILVYYLPDGTWAADDSLTPPLSNDDAAAAAQTFDTLLSDVQNIALVADDDSLSQSLPSDDLAQVADDSISQSVPNDEYQVWDAVQNVALVADDDSLSQSLPNDNLAQVADDSISQSVPNDEYQVADDSISQSVPNDEYQAWDAVQNVNVALVADDSLSQSLPNEDLAQVADE